MSQAELFAAEDTRDLRKARGAFFTPDALTSYMAEWAIRDASARVMEPSCGEAAFLTAAAARLQQLGNKRPELYGYDVHGPSLERARQLLEERGASPRLVLGDFFEQSAESTFDVVLGNPPYVRYQAFTGDSRARGMEAAERQGVRLSRLANAWAAFVVHSAAFLRPGGRLALVLPAALLTVNYAGPVRTFLTRRFGRVRLILFEELVFPGVLEEVVLLLAEGVGPAPGLEIVRARDARDLSGPSARPAVTVVLGEKQDKWTSALLDGDTVDAYREANEGLRFVTLGDWGHIELGIVSGNNKYFALTRHDVAALGLQPSDLLRVSPAGSRHLRGVELSSRFLETMTSEGRATYMFYPKGEPSEAAWAYIRSGEARGIDQAYKCRNRSPWWRVPLVRAPDLIFTYMNGDAPRLIANTAGAHVFNSVHAMHLDPKVRDLGMELLPVAALNSLTLLGGELVGRSYGGGILKLEPREARRLPLPSPESLVTAEDLRAVVPQIGVALRKGDIDRAVELVDDALLIRHLGLPRPAARRLRMAWRDLRERRATRGRTKAR